MLKSSLLASSAIAVLLVCTACDQQPMPRADQPSAEAPTPSTTEQVAAEAANEIEQVAAPQVEITPAELASGVNGENVPDPEATLATAAVKTSNGDAVGEVRSVIVGPDRKADAVIVEVGGFLNVGERAVAIEANKLTYLKERNILVASLAKTDIEKLEPVPAQP